MGDETPQPVVLVVPANDMKAKIKSYLPWILAAVGFAQLMGWIPERTANAIRTTLPLLAKAPEEPRAAIAEAETAVESVLVGKMTPEEEQRLLDLIKKVFDALPQPTPKPVPPTPAPIPTPEPTPVDPVPEPTPEPQPLPPKPAPAPGLLKILVVDELGKPITGNTVAADTLFRVSASGQSGDIAWQRVKYGATRLSVSSDGTEAVAALRAGEWVEFCLTDYGSRKQLTLRIACNEGPRPPPKPLPPAPKPAPTPKPVDPVDPPEKGTVSLAVVYDTLNLPASKADQVGVLNAKSVWIAFREDGSDWMLYDHETTEPLGKKAVADAGDTELPALVIYRKGTRKLLAVMPLPGTVAALRSTVATYTGASDGVHD